MPTDTSSLAEGFFASNATVQFVRLQWVDFSGVLRTRIVTKTRCLHLASGASHYTLAQNCMILPISTAPQYFHDGPEAWELRPDWQTLRICGFAPAHSSVMCFNARLGSSDPFIRCPRKLLSKVLDNFQDQHESKLLMGFEIEFILLDEFFNLANSIDRVAGYSMTAGLRADNLVIMEEIVGSLERSGIEVYHFHTEIADQFELALSPLPPMQAIDALMMAQETIHAVCIRHGLRATMAPKPTFTGPQNGCHVHLSMNPATQQAFFLAGILRKMKSLCAFGMPNYDSYYRVTGDGAGMWIGWGTENRDLPIRQISSNHWELRFLDATANVYLFMAVVLSAGMEGIRKQQLLNFVDCPVMPSEFRIKEAELQLRSYGITEPMPSKLEVSLDSAKDDKELENWLGGELLAQYVKLKEKEVEYFSNMSEEERRQKFLNYF
jgi:glutamine synthetase